jgi:CP family cyanate transporter-like MFS transporter
MSRLRRMIGRPRRNLEPVQEAPVPASGAAASRRGIFVALALAATALRPELVGLGPLEQDVRADLGVSRAAFGLLSSLPLVGMGVFALGAGPLAGRLGTRAAVGCALWTIVVGALLRSLAPSYGSVLAATVLVGVGMGLGNALPPTVVKERLPEVATRATATYTTGVQIGAALGAVLVVPLATLLGGWRPSLAALALLPAAAALSWQVLVSPRPATGALARRVARARPRARPPLSLRFSLAALLACMSWSYYGVVAWMSADLVDAGWTSAAAGVALGLLAAASIVSTIVFGALGDRVGSRTGWIAAAMGAMLLGIVGLVIAPGLGLLWAVAFGMGNGSGFGATMTLPLDLVDDPSAVVTLTGPMLFGGYVLGALSPPVVGLLRDLTGGFTAGFLVLAGLCILAISLARSPILRAPGLSRVPLH